VLLGRNPSVHDARTLRMADYVRQLPASPPARDWTQALPDDLGMMLNDQCGDCAYVAPAHLIQVYTGNRGVMQTPTDADVLSAYMAGTGYDPNKPETDGGASMLDVAKGWRSSGLYGHHIGAFVRVDASDQEEVRAAINLFGGVYLGARMPLRAKQQLDAGAGWSVPGPLTTTDAPDSWGGHAMACAQYDRQGPWLVTWGRRQRCTWQWWANYVDEVYAVLSADWVDGSTPAPSGLDVRGLQDALQRVAA